LGGEIPIKSSVSSSSLARDKYDKENSLLCLQQQYEDCEGSEVLGFFNSNKICLLTLSNFRLALV
jgi:hypothetical protein